MPERRVPRKSLGWSVGRDMALSTSVRTCWSPPTSDQWTDGMRDVGEDELLEDWVVVSISRRSCSQSLLATVSLLSRSSPSPSPTQSNERRCRQKILPSQMKRMTARETQSVAAYAVGSDVPLRDANLKSNKGLRHPLLDKLPHVFNGSTAESHLYPLRFRIMCHVD